MEVLEEKLLKEISDFCNRNTSEWEVSITEQDPYSSKIYSSLCPSTDWTLSISHKDPQNQGNNRMYDISIRHDDIEEKYRGQTIVDTTLFFFFV